MQTVYSAVISKVVFEYLGIPYKMVGSRKSYKEIVQARSLTYWILTKRYGYTYKRVGRIFGYDHSTVHFAVKKIDGYLTNDENTKKQLAVILYKLQLKGLD
jgi:chromosomal replication initiation ATPase DnaA